MRRLLLALWLIVALVCCPRHAHAASTGGTLIASTDIKASGNTTVTTLKTVTSLELRVFVTVVSGTTPQMDLWLESCADSTGSNCAPILATTVSKDPTTITASNPTVTTNARDIVDAKTSTTSEMFTAFYQTLPSSYIRARYIVSGTTPSFTTAAYYQAK